MADISKITDANGNTYDLKDATARGGMVPSGGTTGQYLRKTAGGTEWADAGSIDTVNNISPDANKNVQTVIELTQAQYNALANPDPNVTYLITDGVNNPANNTINSSGVSYDNTDSGLSATNVQDAVDELNAGLTNLTLYRTTYYTGTTASTSATIATITLPAGKYLAWPSGYCSAVGGYLRTGGSPIGEGYVYSVTDFTLTEETTIRVNPVASASTTWTVYQVNFLRISD